MTASATARLVPCPTCGTSSAFAPSNRWRPFCSERCRSVDLGAWASERFRVPAQAPPDSPSDASSDTGTSPEQTPRH